MARLPILATVRKTYRFAFGHLGLLGEASRIWAIAAAIALGVSALLVALTKQAEQDPSWQEPRLSPGEEVGAITGLSVLIIGIALYVIVVKWHRIIIGGATPGESKPRALSAGFLYFARSLLLGGIGLAIALIGGLLPNTLLRGVAMPGEVRAGLPFVLVAGATLTALLVVARLSLILPAGAVGNLAMTFAKAWQVTRGNSWRILLGSLIASGPAIIVNFGLNTFIAALPTLSANTTALTISLLLSLVLAVVAAVIQASFLSYAYLFLVSDKTTGQA